MYQGCKNADGNGSHQALPNGVHSAQGIQENYQPGNDLAVHTSVGLAPGGAHRLVKRNLRAVHIFFIIFSGTIGMGLFSNSGEILNIAGPVGGLIAYIVVGIGVICTMEGIAEMIVHWPIANAMVEFVRAFVDKDLAIVVGFAYWYAYAISFATLIVSGGNLASYWNWSAVLQDFTFIGGVPILLLIINGLGVLWYGNVEAVLGALKLFLVAGSFIIMVVLTNIDTSAPTPNGKIQGSYINDAFQHNPEVASNSAIAVLVCVPIVAYAYIGVEIIAVTALEARNPQQGLKYPAKFIAWITAAMYFFCALSFYLNVRWTDEFLPDFPGRLDHSNTTAKALPTKSIAIIAVLEAKIPRLASVLNCFEIMAVLSASNTALYVASRTLFGLTRGGDPESTFFWWIPWFSITTTHHRVPARALIASALAFFWIPFLRLTKTYTAQDLQEIMSGIATVGVVIVWGVLCLAFIRYRLWLEQHHKKPQFQADYPQFNYWGSDNEHMQFTTILGSIQPIPAYIGLIFSILTVFVFVTASWWNHKQRRVDIFTAFSGPVGLFIFWLILKARRYGSDFEWYVKLGPWDELKKRLDDLTTAIVTDVQQPRTDLVPPTVTHRIPMLVETDGATFEMTPRPSPAASKDTPIETPEIRDSGYNPLNTAAEGLGVRNMSPSSRESERQQTRTPSPRSEDTRWVDPPIRPGFSRRRPVPQEIIPQAAQDEFIEITTMPQPRERPTRHVGTQLQSGPGIGGGRGERYKTSIPNYPRRGGGGDDEMYD